MNTTTRHTQIAKAGQNARYSAILKATTATATHKLQIEIKTDSHIAQAHATISRHDGSEWKILARILPQNMATAQDLAYRHQAPQAADFKADATILIKMAELILA